MSKNLRKKLAGKITEAVKNKGALIAVNDPDIRTEDFVKRNIHVLNKPENVRNRTGYKYFTAREVCPVCDKMGEACRAPNNSLSENVYTKVFCRGIKGELARNTEINDYNFKSTNKDGFKLFQHKSIKNKGFDHTEFQYTNTQKNYKFISTEECSDQMKGLSLILGLNGDVIDFLRSKGLSDFEIQTLRTAGLISSHANNFPVCPPRNNDIKYIHTTKNRYYDNANNNKRTKGYEPIINNCSGFDDSVYIPIYKNNKDLRGNFGLWRKPDTYTTVEEFNTGISGNNFNTKLLESCLQSSDCLSDTLTIKEEQVYHETRGGKTYKTKSKCLIPGFKDYKFETIVESKIIPYTGYTNIDKIAFPSTYVPQIGADGRLQGFPVPMMHCYVTDENGNFLASQLRNLWHNKVLPFPDIDDPDTFEYMDNYQRHNTMVYKHKIKKITFDENRDIVSIEDGGYSDAQKSQIFHNIEFTGKYVWCNPQTSNNHLNDTEKVDSRTEDFEVPLTFASLFSDDKIREKMFKFTNEENFIKTSDPYKVLLCEGILKPQIVNLRTGITTIGASGGNFMSSVRQLNRYILKVQKSGIQSDKTVTVQICPDAGSLDNPGVLRHIVKTLNHLKNLDYVYAEILDWGQLTDKELGDIDEISMETFLNAKKMTVKEFFNLDQVKELDMYKAEMDDESLELWEKTYKSIESRYEFVDRYVTNSTKIEYESNGNEYYRLKFNIKSKADGKVHNIDGTGKIVCIESPLGTGKTELLKSIKDAAIYHKLYLAGYRNSLSKQTLERLGGSSGGAYHIHYNDKKDIKNGEILGFCIDSINKLTRNNDHFILVIDEVSSVINHLMTSNTLKDIRRSATRKLKELIARASQVICLDANIDEMTLKCLSMLSDGKDISLVRNTYLAESVTKNIILMDSYNKEGILKNHDPTIILNNLVEQVEYSSKAGLCVPFITDSRKFAHGAKEKLESMGYRVLVVSSKTKDGDAQREFINDANVHLNNNKYDCILLTPTIESGVDISIDDYFSSIIGHFTGTINVKSVNQMMGRFRKVQDVMLYTSVFNKIGIYQNSLIKTLRAIYQTQTFEADCLDAIGSKIESLNSLKDMVNLTANNIRNMIDSEITNVFESNYAELLTATFFEKTNFGFCLETYLKHKGHNITHLTQSQPTEADKQEYLEIIERIKISEATDIHSAEINPYVHNEKWAHKILSAFSSNYDELCTAKKVLMNVQLPNIIETPLWTVELVYRELFERSTTKGVQRWLKLVSNAVSDTDELDCNELESILEPINMFESGNLKMVGDRSLSEPTLERLRLSIIKKYGVYDLIKELAKDSDGFRGNDPRICDVIGSLKNIPGIKEIMKPFNISDHRYAAILNRIARYIGVIVNRTYSYDLDRTVMEYKRVRRYHFTLPGDDKYPDDILKKLVPLITSYVDKQFKLKLKRVKEFMKRESKRTKTGIFVENTKVYDPKWQKMIQYAGFLTDSIMMMFDKDRNFTKVQI